MPTSVPTTRYARTPDGVSIAYQVIGEGERDLVWVAGWLSHIEAAWEEPTLARFFDRLASIGRLILFDKRGTGMSDRVPASDLPNLDTRMSDLLTVCDAVGAAGAISALAAVLAIRDGLVPPTINYENADPECDLDYVPHVAREMPVNAAMVNGFGFGGQNASTIFRRFQG